MLGLLLLLLMLMISAAGCLKPVSLEDNGYVISVGVDKGTEKKYYISLMLQRESSGQNSSESEGGVIILAAEGEDIFDAVNTIKNNIPYLLNFSRTDFLFFSSEAAKEGLIYEFLNIPLDTLRIRASAMIMITEESAGEFIGGLAANNDANITKLQSAILLDRDKTGMVSIMTASRMYEACNEGRFDFCSALGAYDGSIITDMGQKRSEGEGEDPIADSEKGARIGGLKSMVTGSAMFDGWIMSGTLDRHETMLLNMATGEFKSGIFAFTDESGKTAAVQLELKRSSLRFAGFDEKGTPCFEISVELYGALHVSGASAGVSDAQEWLDKNVAEMLVSELSALASKLRAFSCDAMRLGTEICRYFSSAKGWEAFDWKSEYPDSKVRFTVKIIAADRYASEGMQ